jgi:FtsZ-binding cell division protein ZapB
MDLTKSVKSLDQWLAGASRENLELKVRTLIAGKQVLQTDRDRLQSENEYLRSELRKTEQRISDLQWQVSPDRMGR